MDTDYPLFDWDEANVAHLARHDVKPAEAEQVFVNEKVAIEMTTVDGEARFLEMGETDAGRILFLVTTSRGGKVRPVTSWSANRQHRETYRLWKEQVYGSKTEDSEVSDGS